MLEDIKLELNEKMVSFKDRKNYILIEHDNGFARIIEHDNSFDLVSTYPSERKCSGYRNLVINGLKSLAELIDYIEKIILDISLSKSVLDSEDYEVTSLRNPDTISRYNMCNNLIDIFN